LAKLGLIRTDSIEFDLKFQLREGRWEEGGERDANFLMIFLQLVYGLNFVNGTNAAMAISELQAIQRISNWENIKAIEVC
jgi:hypothetical protein